MAKVAATSTLSPDLFGLGQTVLFEDLVQVVEAQNYAAANHVQRAYFDGSNNPVPFQSGGGVVLQGHLWVPAWALEVEIELETSGGGTITPSVAVGAGSAAFTANTTDLDTIATSSTGTGLLLWTVSGAVSGACQIDSLRLQVLPVAAASLPDPVLE